MSKHTDDREHAQLVKLLPLVSGKVNAVLAKKGKWTESELRERTVQVSSELQACTSCVYASCAQERLGVCAMANKPYLRSQNQELRIKSWLSACVAARKGINA